jgi:hypothetical protein
MKLSPCAAMSKLSRICLQVATFILFPTVAWGAPPPPLPGQSEPKSYVYQYFVVGLSFAMGLALLYRPRKRQTEVERIAADD